MLKTIKKARLVLTKAQPVLLWLITAWFAYRLMVNGIRKFDPEGFWSPAFERWGYPAWFRVFIGVLETAGAVLILIPGVRHFGGIILFLVMLGALITRIVFGTGWDDALSIAHYAVFFLYLATNLDKKKLSD